MSLGLTPGMRLAWASDTGRIAVSFCLASEERLFIALKSNDAGIRIFSKRCIFSATIFSRSIYPLYLILISAASAISSCRSVIRFIRSFNSGIIVFRLLKLSCGRAISSSSLTPNCSGVVPSASSFGLISFALIGRFLQNSSISSISTYFVGTFS